MNMKRAIIIWIGIVLVLSGVIFFVGIGKASNEVNETDEINVSSARTLTSHAPIYINGNADFSDGDDDGVSNPDAAGTEDDPYIIENWDINAGSGCGIHIEIIDVYFIIRNCSVHGGGWDYYGIHFHDVQHGKIENCEIYNNYWGIHLDHSSENNIITSNQIYNNNDDGIYLYSSSNNYIFANHVYNNTFWGIKLKSSPNNNIISTNQVYNNDHGIHLTSSSNNLISANQVYNNVHGIWFCSSSSGNSIFANHIYNNSCDGILFGYSSNNDNIISTNHIYNNEDYGIRLTSSSNNDNFIHYNNFINNTVNAYDTGSNFWNNDYPSSGNYWSDYDEPSEGAYDNNTDGIVDTPYAIPGGSNVDNYPFMEPSGWEEVGLPFHAPVYINGNEDFASQAENERWTGDGTEGNPYIIENYDIDARSAHGIYIENTNVYFIIRNCIIHDGKSNLHYGSYFYSVQNGKIDNVTSYNNYCGIRFRDSSNNQLINSNCYYNIDGVCLSPSSNNNQISVNQIYNNYWAGIALGDSLDNEIHYNNIFNNSNYGVCNYNSESQYVANVTYNWWGDASGPYHPTTNPSGTGDNVTDNVIYDPWSPMSFPKKYYPPSVTITSPSNDLITNQSVTLIYSISSFLEITNIIGPENNTVYTSEEYYKISITVTDEAGVISTAEILFTIDKTPPILNVISPENNTLTNHDVILGYTVSDNVSSAENIMITGDNSPYTADGNYTVTLTATDEAGNSVQATITFTIDKTSPTIFLVSPENNTITNRSITLVYSVYDNFDDAENITITGPENNTVYSDEGEYTVTINATDKAGNNVSKTIYFVLDKTKPVLKILSPENNTVTNQNITLTYSVSDNMDSSADIVVSVENGAVYSEEGDYVITVNASDKAGNNVSKTIYFVIDKTKPTIIIASPEEGLITNQDVTLEYSFSDDTSSAENITVTGDESPYTEEGNYSIMLIATDQAGNTAQDTVTFTIDKTKPTISDVTPATGEKTTEKTITVSGKTDDPNAIVKINDVEVAVGTDGAFSRKITLSKGENDITITATDQAGNTKTETITVTKTEKKQEKSFIPGFETFTLLIALGGCALLLKNRKREMMK